MMGLHPNKLIVKNIVSRNAFQTSHLTLAHHEHAQNMYNLHLPPYPEPQGGSHRILLAQKKIKIQSTEWVSLLHHHKVEKS